MKTFLIAENKFGEVQTPGFLSKYGSEPGMAIGNFLQLIFSLIIIGAGLYALFNLLAAGYSFMSAGDDSKKVAGAWAMIWQTMLGLAFTAGAFVIAAIFGWIIFGNPLFILNPSIPTL